jgi:hypothetical protein
MYREVYIHQMIDSIQDKKDILIYSRFEKVASVANQLLDIKSELFDNEFILEINSDEFDEFLENIIGILEAVPGKKDLFFKDLTFLLSDRNISVETLERVLVFILRIIEKLEDKQRILAKFEQFKMFEYLVDTYIHHQDNKAITLKIMNFLIFCLENGLEEIQTIVLKLLRNNISNSFINAVKKNLHDSYTKFEQRELLRKNFIGIELLSKQTKKDLNNPIQFTSRMFITHLEFLRILCEGHNLDSQNFLRVQSDGEKYNQN